MPQLSVHELLAEMEAMVEDLREELAQNLDFTGLEQVITARLNELGAELVKQVVEPLLIDAGLCRAVEGPGRAAGAEVQGVSVGAGPLVRDSGLRSRRPISLKPNPRVGSGARSASAAGAGGRIWG